MRTNTSSVAFGVGLHPVRPVHPVEKKSTGIPSILSQCTQSNGCLIG
jgi:hypothetical protein